MKDVCLKPAGKHRGGSNMVWGCLTARGVGNLVRNDRIMNAEKYRWILIHNVIPSVKRLIGNGFIFLQDNDPKHTSLKVKSYLKKKEQFGDVQWPSQSLDLNIIESLGDYLDQSVVSW